MQVPFESVKHAEVAWPPGGESSTSIADTASDSSRRYSIIMGRPRSYAARR
jgi:hypothetical protein